MEKKKKSIFKSPHAFVLLVSITIICTIFTWIIPAGQFDRVLDEELGRELLVPGSYKVIEQTPVGPWKMVQSIFNGFVDAADIIFFILMAAAYVYVLMETGALNALTGWLLRKLGKRDNLIIPVFMLLFGVAGSTFGMFEETYGLIPAFVVIAITLGYDRLVGGAIVYVGVATGFAAATLNPFTVGIASAIAGVPLLTGKVAMARIASFILFEALSITYVMRYASKIRKDPTKSIMHNDPDNVRGLDLLMTREEAMSVPFKTEQKISMLGFLVLIVLMSYGIIELGFYLAELASLFLIFMVATCLINKMGPNEIAETFVQGVKSAIFGALIVGIARSISIVITEGNIIDTAVNAMANMVSALPPSLSGIGMLIVQNIINFFIGSGSGQAAVMMPIMAPLSDLVGVSRDVAVLAFQYGDGFSNMFWPTAVAVECGIMGIGLNRWYKFITPLFLMMFALQAIMIVAAVALGL